MQEQKPGNWELVRLGEIPKACLSRGGAFCLGKPWLPHMNHTQAFLQHGSLPSLPHVAQTQLMPNEVFAAILPSELLDTNDSARKYGLHYHVSSPERVNS